MSDIVRKRGDTYPIQFKLLDIKTGEPYNFSQNTFIMTVDPEKNPSTAENNIFSILGVPIDPTEGTIEFYPDVENVDHVGRFWYDIEMTDSEGRVRTLIKAKFQLNQDITK